MIDWIYGRGVETRRQTVRSKTGEIKCENGVDNVFVFFFLIFVGWYTANGYLKQLIGIFIKDCMTLHRD